MSDAPPSAPVPIRQQWNAGSSTIGVWLSTPSSVMAEAASRAGFDYACIDMQHGLADYRDAVGMIQAVLLGGTSPIVRVPWNEQGIIGRVLDAGAHGVIIPMVNTVAQAEAAVAACRYAPGGARSFGPAAASLRTADYGAADYKGWAADNVACIPMIETVEAMSNLDAILAVPGIDGVYVGPADLSITLGLPPRNNDGEPAFDEAFAEIVAACQRAGVVPGCHATGELTPKRLAAGFRMVTATADMVAAKIGFAQELGRAHADSGAASTDSLY